MPRLRPVRRSSRAARAGGFSYVEVLLTVLLLSLVVGGILPLLTGGEESYEELRRRQEMIQNARVALDKLLRELRVAESFRVLSPATIRFTLFWGDGSGASPTAEYVLNGATGDLEYRWSADWDYRRQITVTAADAVAAGYAVGLTANHAALVGAGRSLANGNDVRVRYWNGTEMVELDRVLDPASSWNSTATTLWFRLPVAIANGVSNNNYYLYYGNLAALAPPQNGDNIFLDYENGTTLGGWTRRDAEAGAYGWSPADGFIFTTAAGSGNGYRELSKNVPHGNVEIFWNFQSNLGGNSNIHQIGVSARRSDAGAGYQVTPVERVGGSWRLRIRETTGWGAAGNVIGNRTVSYTPGTSYYGKFYLVGTSLRVKFWPAGPEPAWICEGAGANAVCITDSTSANGNHYALQDGNNTPQDHRHRTLIMRPRVANEPLLTLGAETPGGRPDALESLAGPFRSMTVTCYDVEGNVVDCSPATQVRSVQVTLVVMDPSGRIPDITVTGRTFRQSP